MLTCASRLNTQPQWTHSSAFVRQREGEFRIGGVAQDLYPEAFILLPATLPLLATVEKSRSRSQGQCFTPPFYHLPFPANLIPLLSDERHRRRSRRWHAWRERLAGPPVCQTRRELLPDDLCDRGSVTREARKARAQRAFTRRAHFVATKAAPVAQLQTERFLFLEQLKSLLQPAPVSQVKFQQRYQMRNRILSKAVPAWAIVP
jgi:hypothetical protein